MIDILPPHPPFLRAQDLRWFSGFHMPVEDRVSLVLVAVLTRTGKEEIFS